MLYGSQHTLHCGDLDSAITEGEWIHNGEPLGVYSRSYTIANARFSDDGEYRCRRNGSRTFVLFSPFALQVYVHGKPFILSHTHAHNCHVYTGVHIILKVLCLS